MHSKHSLNDGKTQHLTLPGTHATHIVVPLKKHLVKYSSYADCEHYETHAFIAGLDASMTRTTDAPPSEDKIKIGDCILVQYEGARQKLLKYVAQVIDIQESEFHVIHYHKSDERGTLFVAKDVTDKYGWVEEKQIVRKLPAPVMDNRSRKLTKIT